MKKLSNLLHLLLVLIMALSPMSCAIAEAEPIRIQFWHARGSGVNLEAVTHEIDTFNATIGAEKGIVVEGVFQGSYDDVLSKTQLGVMSGEGPQLVQIEHNNVLTLYDDDMLYAMNGFVESDDDFNLDNIFTPLTNGNATFDGNLVALPYTRSSVIFVYNAGMTAEKGLAVPTTVDELVEWGRGMAEYNSDGSTKVYAMHIGNDAVSYLHPILIQMGSGLVNQDVTDCPAIDDGTMLNVLSQWRSWIDEGWCMPFAAADDQARSREQFYQGLLGGFYTTTGSLGQIIEDAKKFDVEVGVTFPVRWGETQAIGTGGANICIVKNYCTEEQAAAAWEFVKFVVSDEIQAYEMMTTGYTACNKNSAELPELNAFMTENPQYIPGYEALNYATVIPGSPNRRSFTEAVRMVCSLLIQEQSITPERAVEMIEEEAAANLF